MPTLKKSCSLFDQSDNETNQSITAKQHFLMKSHSIFPPGPSGTPRLYLFFSSQLSEIWRRLRKKCVISDDSIGLVRSDRSSEADVSHSATFRRSEGYEHQVRNMLGVVEQADGRTPSHLSGKMRFSRVSMHLLIKLNDVGMRISNLNRGRTSWITRE